MKVCEAKSACTISASNTKHLSGDSILHEGQVANTSTVPDAPWYSACWERRWDTRTMGSHTRVSMTEVAANEYLGSR